MTDFKIAILSGLVASLATLHASAEGWAAQQFTQEFDTRGGSVGDFVYTGVMLRTTDTSKPEIRLGCSEKYGLTATISFEPIDTADDRKQGRINMRTKRTNLKVEGRETENVLWTVIKETRTVQSRGGKTAAMIYNALVEGRAITIDEPYRSEVTLTAPPPDEHFTYFAKNCHVTNGS